MATAKSLTTAELERVLDYIANNANAERNKLMLSFGVLAGLRVSEIAGLTLGDVLDTDGQVRSEIYLASHRVKHGHARTIFLNTRLQQELADYLVTRTLKDANLPLFSTQRGARCAFSPNTLTQYWHYLFSACGIDNASSHSMRRSFATQISSKGVGIRVLQKLMGHRSAQTTMVYIDASDDMMRKAVELV